MAAVGILLPQLLWVIDFVGGLFTVAKPPLWGARQCPIFGEIVAPARYKGDLTEKRSRSFFD
jgi:hypothetical protein